MAPMNPKFTEHIRKLIDQRELEKPRGRQGVIIDYNIEANTATVLLAASDSDLPTDIIKHVPCPTMLGVQPVAPEPGRLCWVAFRGASEANPVITHFYNHSYAKYDLDRQTNADTGVPRFLFRM